MTFRRPVSRKGAGGRGGSMIAWGQGGNRHRELWIAAEVCRFLSFLPSPYLWYSPPVKGRLCRTLQPETENSLNKPGPGVTDWTALIALSLGFWSSADQATHTFTLMAEPELHSGRISSHWLRHMSVHWRAYSVMANEVKRPSNIYKSTLWSIQCRGAAVLTPLPQLCTISESVCFMAIR